MSIKMGFGTPPTTVVTKHTELTDKETAGVIDHADLSVTDGKLASGVGLSDGQICKLPTAAEDKVLKRGASDWEAGDVVLEGDYSDWTIYDSFDDANMSAGPWRQYAVVNKDETIILLLSRYYVGATKYTIATKVLGSLMDEYRLPGVAVGTDTGEGTTLSIQGTYVVGLIHAAGFTTGNGIVIWKNGALLTKTAAELGFNANMVYSISISKSGKYIILSGQRTATGNPGWVVLVGS